MELFRHVVSPDARACCLRVRRELKVGCGWETRPTLGSLGEAMSVCNACRESEVFLKRERAKVGFHAE